MKLNIKSIFYYFLSLMIFTSQLSAANLNAQYTTNIYSVKNSIKSLLSSSESSDINYSSLINNLNDQLFNGDHDSLIAEIISKSKNEKVSDIKLTDFVPKNAGSSMDQSGSMFGKTYSLDYNDDDGMYIGFVEDHLSTLSRGYYIKNYNRFDKLDGISKDYIELGKANFVEDLATGLFNYKMLTNDKNLQPFLLSYLNYQETYYKFEAPNTYVENDRGWNGLINVNSNDNSIYDIKEKLKSLKSPLDIIEKRSFTELTGESNKLFQEGGKVLNYRTKSPTEDTFSHLSMANTYMANNNLKRGFIFKPVNSQNNYKFKSHKKCSGKIVKKCKYWQTLKLTGGMDIFTSSFLDESYLDDWKEISFNNSDAITGGVFPPTMIPINSYAKLPGINTENYGYLYSTNYVGSQGGYGLYDYPMGNIDGINSGILNIKSDKITTKGFGLLAMLIVLIIMVVLIVVTAGAAGAYVAATAGNIVTMTAATAAVGGAALTGAISGLVLSVLVAAYVLSNMHKDADSGYEQGLTSQQQKTILDTSTDLLPQAIDPFGSLELAESSTLNGLIRNSNMSSSNKNFMSGTFHDVASTYAKNDMNSINTDFFGNQLGVLAGMDGNTKFWKQRHKTQVINFYKNTFRNDGKAAPSNSYYNMKKIFRNQIKNYTGY